MPESKGRPRPRKSARPEDAGRAEAPKAQQVGNPSWFVPVMCGLMIFGVLWVATFYIATDTNWPAPIGYWNLVVGLGAIMAGFIMATRWR